MEAASVVASVTDDRDIIAAALLHDVVEDAGIDIGTIKEEFGGRVAALVASETEDKRRGIPSSLTWEIRKAESLEVLSSSGEDVKILWLGDKLSNIRSYYRVYLEKGDAMWEMTHQKDIKKQYWYYSEIARLTSSLRKHAAWMEYDRLVKEVFKSVINNA